MQFHSSLKSTILLISVRLVFTIKNGKKKIPAGYSEKKKQATNPPSHLPKLGPSALKEL